MLPFGFNLDNLSFEQLQTFLIDTLQLLKRLQLLTNIDPSLRLEFAGRESAFFTKQRCAKIAHPAVLLKDRTLVLCPFPSCFGRKEEEPEDLTLCGRIPDEGAAIFKIKDQVPEQKNPVSERPDASQAKNLRLKRILFRDRECVAVDTKMRDTEITQAALDDNYMRAQPEFETGAGPARAIYNSSGKKSTV